MTSPRYDDFWATMDPTGSERARMVPIRRVTRRELQTRYDVSLTNAKQDEAEALFSFALWYVRNETPADCARRAIREVPQGMTLAHCDHVAFLPGFFCRMCKAGTPLRATEWA